MKRPMHPRKRLAWIIHESRQFITDVESWNDNRPDCPAMDCEVERVVLEMATRAARLLDLVYHAAQNRKNVTFKAYADGSPNHWEIAVCDGIVSGNGIQPLKTKLLELAAPKPQTVMVEVPLAWAEFRAHGRQCSGILTLRDAVDAACKAALETRP